MKLSRLITVLMGGGASAPWYLAGGEFIGDAYVPATTFPVFGAFVIEAA